MSITLDQLASVKIATLTNEIDEINSNIVINQTLLAKYQAIYDSTPDDTIPNRNIRSSAKLYIDSYSRQISLYNQSLTAKTDTISNITTSLTALNDADKVLCATLLTTYPINTNNFDFNVKQSFVNQVRTIYENVDYDNEFKQNMICELASRYRSVDYP